MVGGPPLLLVPGSRDSPGSRVTRCRPPFRGVGTTSIVPSLPMEIQTKEEHLPRARNRRSAANYCPNQVITIVYRACSSVNLNYASPLQCLEWYNRDRCKPSSTDSINPSQRKQTYHPQCARNKSMILMGTFQLRHTSTQSYTAKKLSYSTVSLYEYQHFYDFYIWYHLFFYKQQSWKLSDD